MSKTRRNIAVAAVLLLWAVVFWVMPMTHSARAFASVRDTVPTLQIKKVKELPVPGAGWYLEGGTSYQSGNQTLYLLAFWKNGVDSTYLKALDPNNGWAVVKEIEAMSPAHLSHANDMCYVPKDEEICVTPMRNNELMTFKTSDLNPGKGSTYGIGQTYHAIGYDIQQDRYAAAYVVNGSGASRKINCDILKKVPTEHAHTYNSMGTFPISTNLTYQGLTVHNSLIYYTCWERGGTSAYEVVYDGVFQANDNVIYVYDFSGNLIKTLLITPPEGYSKFELETASFLGEKMILQFNVTLNDAAKTRKVEIYEVLGEGPSLEQQRQEEAKRAAAASFPNARTRITRVVRKKKQIRLTWAPLTFAGEPVTGYQIQFCRKKNFKGKTRRNYYATKLDGNSMPIRRLQRKTTYFVRIRAYQTVDGVKIYSQWSQRRKVKTR